MSDAETLRVQATRLLDEYDELRRRLKATEHTLNKACADYGRATNRWGFSPQHLRIDLQHREERVG